MYLIPFSIFFSYENCVIHQQAPLNTNLKVKLDVQPFAKGGLRYALHMAVVGTLCHYVAKCSIDPYEDLSAYYQVLCFTCSFPSIFF